MASRSLDDLTDELKVKAEQLLVMCMERRLKIIITCTARTRIEQSALYAQGRNSLDDVNALRRACGLSPITKKENCRKVTWTLNSKHIVESIGDKARAFDFALLRGAKVHWELKADVNENEVPDYMEVGLLAESIGLKWGGHFGDPPHIEL